MRIAEVEWQLQLLSVILARSDPFSGVYRVEGGVASVCFRTGSIETFSSFPFPLSVSSHITTLNSLTLFFFFSLLTWNTGPVIALYFLQLSYWNFGMPSSLCRINGLNLLYRAWSQLSCFSCSFMQEIFAIHSAIFGGKQSLSFDMNKGYYEYSLPEAT